MRSETAVWIAIAVCVLTIIGAVIALVKGARVIGVVESVGNISILTALIFGKPIARLFPSRATQIAVGVALVAALIGVLSIYYYSTEHIALSLMTVGVFWQLSADLLSQHGWLMNKSLGDIYREFKAGRVKPQSPIAKTLGLGATALFLASIVCLFTITTW
jgi:hypothetical protein